MVDVKELLTYNDEVARKYFECMKKVGWDRFVEDRGASWGSMRNIAVHTLEAVDYWLDVLKGEKIRVVKKFEEYGSYDDVEGYMNHVESRMRNYLQSLSAEGLKKEYTVKNDAGETVTVTAEDVLIHLFDEQVHHRGELIALLWQINVTPPIMGWKML